MRKPELVTLFGEELNVKDLTVSINLLSDKDLDTLLGSGFYPDDREYIETHYPEMMGIAVTAVTSIVGAVGGLISRIAKRIRARRRDRKKDKRYDQARQRKIDEQNAITRAVIQRNKDAKKKQLMIAVAGIALLAYII